MPEMNLVLAFVLGFSIAAAIAILLFAAFATASMKFFVEIFTKKT